MRILSAAVKSFASYKELSFEFNNQGLALISGPTGSGKSTLCDIIPWCLFGVTAKNGAVDEVRSWSGKEPTKGIIVIQLGTSRCEIVRTRGKGNNDLYLNLPDGNGPTRGKDLLDTQKLINNLLGIDADMYLAGAYYHEFSKTAQFFSTTAKNRRQITEQIVDLSLPKMLNENMNLFKKELKEELTQMRTNLAANQQKHSYVNNMLETSIKDAKDWDEQQKAKIAKTKSLFDSFEKIKVKELEEAKLEYEIVRMELQDEINELEQRTIKNGVHYNEHYSSIDAKILALKGTHCEHCGAPKNNDQLNVLQRERFKIDNMKAGNEALKTEFISKQRMLEKHLSPTGYAIRGINDITNKINTYGDQLAHLKSQENPYIKNQKSTKETLVKLQADVDYDQKQITLLVNDLDDIELLLSVNESLRAELVKNAIIELEDNTNDLLNKHFDAEIRVIFNMAEADKLEVTILKDGNEAVYTQLSKGQRQLLKLCFGISVMKSISNHNAVKFNTIFLDEAFDGLSEELKVKAYGLLQNLSLDHSSVFVVDHSNELKSLFDNKFEVSLIDGNSTIDNT